MFAFDRKRCFRSSELDRFGCSVNGVEPVLVLILFDTLN